MVLIGHPTEGADRPIHQSTVNGRRALDRKWAERLAVRHQADDVDRDVGWARSDPVHRIRNILRGERRGAGVHGLRSLIIPGEPHVGEFGSAAQSGFDAAGAHTRANQIGI